MSEGLRERKKRETRERISDIATGLFLARGFDDVTVAEVARAADVSVNTVFNYFATKEDLLLDRAPEVEDLLARIVRERRPGESVLAAVRRDFLNALETGHYRYGFHEAGDGFVRMIEATPSLAARVREMDEARERRMAEAIAEELGSGPDDLAPAVVAAQIGAALRTVVGYGVRRMLAGEDVGSIAPGLRERAERAFGLLESGIGGYCTRPADRSRP
ncbi:TetR family transcriptional regulator [Planomonospora parontospora subsp. parontospora]|uniref:TetR family transcriptional regulator n=2 Tax=Planomonospora parontospora TaxID=58119 RepID=A0AA37F6D0_9ACTN|nr:TetR/AcrR family transcriptional regulator [Planomonospora parontospora]GGK83140.1 TetR family transcriptional regulator [Planomonospora parontospora]GII10423.1 TetR family transcriptional regulator [Planomonospora parontospora subsp. parontospora]